MRQFGELMTLLGIEPGEAQAIAGAAADWIDSDSNEGRLGAEDNVYRSMQSAYLPANRKMADVSELRAVRGVTPKIYRSEEHTSELQSLMRISYAVFCLKKKTYRKCRSHQSICNHHT